MAEGRAVHRIWRIEVGQDSAVVHVHHDDVASCVGLIEYRGEQVKAEGERGSMPAQMTVACYSHTIVAVSPLAPCVCARARAARPAPNMLSTGSF